MSGCKYQDICPNYSIKSFTCRNNGGFGTNFRSYCGTFRRFEKLFEKKSRKNLLNLKNLLLEVIPEHDLF